MNKSEIITKLKYIINNSNKLNLFELYRISISPNYIKEIVPMKIYNNYLNELNCVNYESFLGDGLYDEDIKNDYIFAIKEILKYLNTYEDI